MADEMTQPSGDPTPTPPSTLQQEIERLKQELATSERKYNGLDGSFKKVKTDYDSLKTQLDNVSQTSEGEKASLKVERDTLKKNLDDKVVEFEQLNMKFGTTAEELETLRLVSTEFIDLAPMFAKGLIRPGGLKGDELKTFLTDWRTTFEQMGVALGNKPRDNGGATPPAPNPDISSMTLDEASERKIKALRTGGPNSKDYQQYAAIEEDLIRKRKK